MRMTLALTLLLLCSCRREEASAADTVAATSAPSEAESQAIEVDTVATGLEVPWSLAFAPDAEPPGGKLSVVLAGGGEIRMNVECLDALLLDMGAPWPTPLKPNHEDAR